jgi:hypothetical protein
MCFDVHINYDSSNQIGEDIVLYIDPWEVIS